jgi:carbon monoxide dehydrogenase subunit G
VAVSGSGEVKLAGSGESLKVSVSGSGEVDAKDFAARDASVSIAGSGDVDLRLAGGTLNAQIAGSGDVTWSGEGKVGAVATAGSGRVRRR